MEISTSLKKDKFKQELSDALAGIYLGNDRYGILTRIP
jgi:hypothetical protein